MATNTLSTLLRQLMQNHGKRPISVSELARRTGMSRTTVHRHLHDYRPTMAHLAKYAEVFDVPLGELCLVVGYVAPQPLPADAMALAAHLARLDPEVRAAIWTLVIRQGGGDISQVVNAQQD